MLQSLAEVPSDHPALWGRLAVRPSEPLITLDDALVLPPRSHRGVKHWWRRHSYGVFDRLGQHVSSLNDMRGERHCCHPPSRLESCIYRAERTVELPLVLYGGSLYDHFGHLLVETARAYQLLRHYRDSPLTLWFHDSTPHRGSTLKLGFVKKWLKCMGIRQRVRLIRRPILAKKLISSCALYNDRYFVSADIRIACQAALKPKLASAIAEQAQTRRRVAYLSRHKLQTGSTKFTQETELVERLRTVRHVDVICPEELTFRQKLRLYQDYEFICGFPQSCMNLKLFVPGDDLAKQVMFIAGPRSLSSSWVNIEQATHFGDYYVDCPGEDEAADPNAAGVAELNATRSTEDISPFQRCNDFDVDTVFATIKHLAH